MQCLYLGTRRQTRRPKERITAVGIKIFGKASTVCVGQRSIQGIDFPPYSPTWGEGTDDPPTIP